jgi:probable rRNA maturation factor
MIEINNLTTNQIDEEFLSKVAKIVLKGEHPPLGEVGDETKVSSSPFANARVPEESELSIALVGQGRMRELNKKFFKKNRVTDVLAFPNKEIGLGEIVICLREVKKNAKRYNLTFEKELSKVLIHGILHLLGYDHEKNEFKAKKMEEKENYYLSQVN